MFEDDWQDVGVEEGIKTLPGEQAEFSFNHHDLFSYPPSFSSRFRRR
jgi:hypothetical protein